MGTEYMSLTPGSQALSLALQIRATQPAGSFPHGYGRGEQAPPKKPERIGLFIAFCSHLLKAEIVRGLILFFWYSLLASPIAGGVRGGG